MSVFVNWEYKAVVSSQSLRRRPPVPTLPHHWTLSHTTICPFVSFHTCTTQPAARHHGIVSRCAPHLRRGGVPPAGRHRPGGTAESQHDDPHPDHSRCLFLDVTAYRAASGGVCRVCTLSGSCRTRASWAVGAVADFGPQKPLRRTEGSERHYEGVLTVTEATEQIWAVMRRCCQWDGQQIR